MRLPPSLSKLPDGRLRQSLSDGNWGEALSHFIAMRRSGFQLTDPSLFPAVMKACSNISFSHGACVHACSVKQGFEHFTSMGNSTINLYLKWGFMDVAASVFQGIRNRDSVSWNTIAHGYLDRGDYEQGLRCFKQARGAGFDPNVATLVLLLLQACRSLGKGIHGYLMRSGLWGVVSLQNVMLGLYCDDGDLLSAGKVFDEMPHRDVISWSMLMGGLLQWEEPVLALELFADMVTQESVEPDGLTLVSALNACSAARDIDMGASIHGFVLSRGFDGDVFVGNSLIDMYSKCADPNSACRAFNETPFKNNVSWNSIISGLVHNQMHSEAVVMFHSMRMAGVEEDDVTLTCLLQACKGRFEPQQCKLIHSRLCRRGFESNQLLVNCLIDAYAKCNLIRLSQQLFNQVKSKNKVSWGTMIAGLGHCGMPEEAMATFHQMIESGETPNEIIILNLVEASGSTAELSRAKWAHGIATRRGLSSEVAVGTGIVETYSKCGAIEQASRAFEQIRDKNTVSWSAMIGAYGMNGQAHQSLALYSEMKRQGLKPNQVTALSVLSACSHGGLVTQGLRLFKEMVEVDKMRPEGAHYGCVVDLLSRSGRVEEAMELMEAGGGGGSAWGALLSGCRSLGKTEIGQGVAARLMEVEPGGSGGYMMATAMHAMGGEWEDVGRLRRLIRDRGVKVLPAHSVLYVDGRGFKFVAGDRLQLHSLEGVVECSAILQGLHSCIASHSNKNNLLDFDLLE